MWDGNTTMRKHPEEPNIYKEILESFIQERREKEQMRSLREEVVYEMLALMIDSKAFETHEQNQTEQFLFTLISNGESHNEYAQAID